MHSEPDNHEWTDDELAELEDESAWDWESAQTHPPSSTPGAVVQVRLERDDFRRIAAAANARGIRLVDFVRTAALERAAESENSSDRHTRSAD